MPTGGAAFEKQMCALFAAPVGGASPESVLDQAVGKLGTDFLTASEINTSITEHEIAAKFSAFTMPDAPKDPAGYVDTLVEKGGVADAIHTSNPLMIGHMTTALPYYMRPLSRLLTTMNQNVVKTETAKTFTFLEREALAQLHKALYGQTDEFYAQHVQNPGVMLGMITSGGTLANLTALWIGRNNQLGPAEGFAGIEKEGLFKALNHHGFTDAKIIGSALMHYSMAKAADLLGLGLNGLVKVPVNDYYEVDLELLEAEIKGCLERKEMIVALVGICGATETGAIDPLEDMAALAKKYNLHFHVDAAWGGPNVFSKKQSALVKGITDADTITLDGHKQLYLPMGAGMCFMKDPESCLSIRKTANYIIRKESYDLGKFTVEGSRPGVALYLHANLNILGIKGYECLIDRSVRIAQYMAKEVLSSNCFELLVKPMANILLYRYLPEALRETQWTGGLTIEQNAEIDEMNRKLQDKQKFIGKTFVSRTTLRCPKYDVPIVALRVVIGNPLTDEAEIDAVFADQLDVMATLSKDSNTLLATKPGGRTEKLSQSENSGGYWSEYWEQLPAQQRKVFRDDESAFIRSLAHYTCPMTSGTDDDIISAVSPFPPSSPARPSPAGGGAADATPAE